MKKDERKAFCGSGMNKMQLVFPNGNWLSTIWGIGTYSDNHKKLLHGMGKAMKELKTNPQALTEFWNAPQESDTVEIMFECPKRLENKILAMLNAEEQPCGWVSQQNWLEVLMLLAE